MWCQLPCDSTSRQALQVQAVLSETFCELNGRERRQRLEVSDSPSIENVQNFRLWLQDRDRQHVQMPCLIAFINQRHTLEAFGCTVGGIGIDRDADVAFKAAIRDLS